METNLIITKENDEIFKDACTTHAIKYDVVEERHDGFTYKITYHITNDLWYLGFLMGLQKGTDIFRNVIKETY